MPIHNQNESEFQWKPSVEQPTKAQLDLLDLGASKPKATNKQYNDIDINRNPNQYDFFGGYSNVHTQKYPASYLDTFERSQLNSSDAKNDEITKATQLIEVEVIEDEFTEFQSGTESINFAAKFISDDQEFSDFQSAWMWTIK